MTNGINGVASMYPSNGYYNCGDDYFGLNSLANNNIANSSIYGTTGAYNPYMTPGMYSIPQNLWNDPKGQMQYQYDMNNTANGYGIKSGAQQVSLTDQCSALAQVIGSGQEDEILKEFNELSATLKSQPQYAQCSEQEIKGLAKQYFQAVTGVSLNEAIENNASGDFETGFKKSFSLFGDDNESKEDLLAEVNGTKLKRGAEATKTVGEVAGVAAIAGAGAGIGAAVGTFVFPVIGTGVGAAIGGIVGGAVGILKSIF